MMWKRGLRFEFWLKTNVHGSACLNAKGWESISISASLQLLTLRLAWRYQYGQQSIHDTSIPSMSRPYHNSHVCHVCELLLHSWPTALFDVENLSRVFHESQMCKELEIVEIELFVHVTAWLLTPCCLFRVCMTHHPNSSGSMGPSKLLLHEHSKLKSGHPNLHSLYRIIDCRLC